MKVVEKIVSGDQIGSEGGRLDLVTVASYREVYRAHIARSLLESAGIEGFVTDEHMVGMDWLYSQALGGVKLQVSSERAQEAIELLRAPIAFETAEDGDQVEAAACCPACGSAVVVPDKLDTRLRAASLFVGVPLSVGGYRRSCAQCGHRWRSVPGYRGLMAFATECVVLAGIFAVWLVRLPFRMFLGFRDYFRNERCDCWSCGAPYASTLRTCPECGIALPDLEAYHELVTPGRAYDGVCNRCHTPYALEDYAAGRTSRACSRCGARLPDASTEFDPVEGGSGWRS